MRLIHRQVSPSPFFLLSFVRRELRTKTQTQIHRVVLDMSLGAFSLVLVQELRVESTNIIYVKSDNKHASDLICTFPYILDEIERGEVINVSMLRVLFQTLKLESYEERGAPW